MGYLALHDSRKQIGQEGREDHNREGQPAIETTRALPQRQRAVAQAVEQAEVQNGQVLAQHLVCSKAAKGISEDISGPGRSYLMLLFLQRMEMA